MINGINKTHYCSAEFGICGGDYDVIITCKNCPAFHRKYPTPEQYKEEYYKKDYPKHWAVYYLSYYDKETNGQEWEISTLENLELLNIKADVILCSCTPWGRPDSSIDWR